MAANAHNKTAISSAEVTLFHASTQKNSVGDYGSQNGKCLAFAIANDGAGDILLNSSDHHASDEWMRLASGSSVTFRTYNNNQTPPALGIIKAKRADSTDSTVSGGVVEVA